MAPRNRIRAGIPKTLVVILGVAWAWMTWGEVREQMARPGNIDTEVVLQYYDRELRMTEAGGRSGGYGGWISGADEVEEWLEQSRRTIRETYLPDLALPGIDLLDAIALRLEEQVTPDDGRTDPDYRMEMKEYLLSGEGRAWDFELFLAAGEDPTVRDFYETRNDSLLRRSVWSGTIYQVLFLLGLAAAGYVFLKKRVTLPQASRVPDSWAATTVLGGFFLANLLLTPWVWALYSGYEIYYAFGGLLDLYLLFDFLWRCFPALFLTLLFLKYPQHPWRVFNLGKGVNWLLLLAGLGMVGALDWLLYLAAPVSGTDPTDFMETASPDAGPLIALLVSSVILAPVFEEISFRGFLFQGLKSKTGRCGRRSFPRCFSPSFTPNTMSGAGSPLARWDWWPVT